MWSNVAIKCAAAAYFEYFFFIFLESDVIFNDLLALNE